MPLVVTKGKADRIAGCVIATHRHLFVSYYWPVSKDFQISPVESMAPVLRRHTLDPLLAHDWRRHFELWLQRRL